MTFSLDFDVISSTKMMCAITIGMAVFWTIVLETSKKWIYDALPRTGWWKRAVQPTTSFMQNFGYPRKPTDNFPKGVTEPMARDFYCFLVTVSAQHFVSAAVMVPVVYYGWEEASDTHKSLFVLGTLSDMGFNIYDAIKSTIRTFLSHHPAPLPIEYWVAMICLHHTVALALILPMNMFHVHLVEYHQACVSLLLAGSICLAAGAYKFSLDVTKKRADFLTYKAVVVFQLLIILYTRGYLWFPQVKNALVYFSQRDDTAFLYGGSVFLSTFSLFNGMTIIDAVKAAVKWLPKKMPAAAPATSCADVRKAVMSDNHQAVVRGTMKPRIKSTVAPCA